jgi:pimeloyl-ACP methyl ester carboxylesterase
VSQFHPLLTSLVNLTPCLAIDLPGCGLSELNPKSWDAYRQEHLVELVGAAIDRYRDKEAGQGIILLGHSLGMYLITIISRSNPMRL